MVTSKWLKSPGRRTPATAQGLATQTEPPQVHLAGPRCVSSDTEAAARAETDRARADAERMLADFRAEATRERDEMRADLRARAEREADAYRDELARLRDPRQRARPLNSATHRPRLARRGIGQLALGSGAALLAAIHPEAHRNPLAKAWAVHGMKRAAVVNAAQLWTAQENQAAWPGLPYRLSISGSVSAHSECRGPLHGKHSDEQPVSLQVLVHGDACTSATVTLYPRFIRVPGLQPGNVRTLLVDRGCQLLTQALNKREAVHVACEREVFATLPSCSFLLGKALKDASGGLQGDLLCCLSIEGGLDECRASFLNNIQSVTNAAN